MDSDGSNRVRLTNTHQDETNPSWSPDGNKILFHSKRTGINQVFVMDSDGSHQINLTNTNVYEQQATWSPDGRKIAFTSFREDNALIYVMNTDGTDTQKVIESKVSLSYPVWSPDSQQIVCMSHNMSNGKFDYFRHNFKDEQTYPLFWDMKHPYRFYGWSQNDEYLIFRGNHTI